MASERLGNIATKTLRHKEKRTKIYNLKRAAQAALFILDCHRIANIFVFGMLFVCTVLSLT